MDGIRTASAITIGPVAAAPAASQLTSWAADVPGAPLGLNDNHLAALRASGIPETTAKALGLHSAGAEDVQRILGRTSGVGGGLVIPYFNLEGTALKVQLRQGDFTYAR